MFQRFTSALFGDGEVEESTCTADLSFGEKEEEDEWILVDYLAEACTKRCAEGKVGSCPIEEDSCDCPIHYSSCSSLDSAGGENGSFLRLEAGALEESWFVTPPPCFTAGGQAPMLLETSPMENLLIEHPSMSVYAVHGPRHTQRDTALCSIDQSLFRVEAQRGPGHHNGCYAAALSAHNIFLEQAKQARLAQAVQDSAERRRLSRSALRRINLLHKGATRQAKNSGLLVHQPMQKQLNY